MHLKGLITIKDIEKAVRYPNSARDKGGRLLCGAAIGATKDVLDRVAALVEAQVDVVTLDSAHGHNNGVLDACAPGEEALPRPAGHRRQRGHRRGHQALIDAGADCVKVGIGPGSICTTRVVAGIGVPQITAVYDAATEASKHGIPVIADGGIKYSGDIVKALAPAAPRSCWALWWPAAPRPPASTSCTRGRQFKVYGAWAAWAPWPRAAATGTSRASRRSSSPEGVEGRVPFKGPLADTVFQLLGGCGPAWATLAAPISKSSTTRPSS